jgi:3-phosphoshikimate 1-carboxyvinyltransferase
MKSWPAELPIAPIVSARGVVRLPGSKSLSNRALLLAALADGQTALAGLLDADDTRVMIAALRALGIRVDAEGERDSATTQVHGCAGQWPNRSADLHLGNAGTAMRSLTAALAFAGGRFRLDGVPRMRERPIGDLVDALNALGADVRYEGRAGFPPLLIGPAALGSHDRVEIRGEVSSQFVSGLLMAAPTVAPAGGLAVEVPGTLISQPYVAMTVELMRRFGVVVERNEGNEHKTCFRVPRATYHSPGRLEVEGDASGASYFLALGALAGGPVRVNGAGRASVQGDVAFAGLLEQMGARVTWGDDWIECARGAPGGLQGGTFDCTSIPDAAMTAAIVGMFASGRTELRGIGSWRVKETDRIAAMATELAKVGARVDSGADWIAVEPPAAWRSAAIDTYDDHRIAMCFSLAACGGVPVRIRDPGCVEKTYPKYFDELARLTAGTSARVGK